MQIRCSCDLARFYSRTKRTPHVCAGGAGKNSAAGKYNGVVEEGQEVDKHKTGKYSRKKLIEGDLGHFAPYQHGKCNGVSRARSTIWSSATASASRGQTRAIWVTSPSSTTPRETA